MQTICDDIRSFLLLATTEGLIMVDNGEVVIITGGANGIGRVYAHELAAKGYRVVIADLADTAPTVEEIKKGGGKALGVALDVSSEASTLAMAERVMKEWERIDVLINNAAYFSDIRKAPFAELTVDEWRKALDVNVIGTWLCAKAVVPAMRKRSYGKIINTSSMTVPTGVPGFLHYVASKSAIIGLTNALAREVGADGICVNTISPCYVPHNSAYVAKQEDAMGAAIIQERVLRRAMTPNDLVGTILHLVGHGSDFVTGQNFYVNGGRVFN
jgi:3-oxoacyl-[acyl-carrier protein] reductase